MVAHLLSIDDLESLLHLATLCAPALFIRDQGYVGVFGDAVITCATVHTLAIVVITQVIIATTEASKIKILEVPSIIIVISNTFAFIQKISGKDAAPVCNE